MQQQVHRTAQETRHQEEDIYQPLTWKPSTIFFRIHFQKKQIVTLLPSLLEL